MGKVDRLCNRVVPFAALFWALGNVSDQHLTLHPGPTSLHRRTQSSMSLYFHSWFTIILNKDAPPPPPFSYLGVLFIYGYTCSH